MRPLLLVASVWLDQALLVLLRETPAVPAERLGVGLLLRRFVLPDWYCGSQLWPGVV